MHNIQSSRSAQSASWMKNIRSCAAKVVTAGTMACMLATPLTALAAEQTTESVPLEAQGMHWEFRNGGWRNTTNGAWYPYTIYDNYDIYYNCNNSYNWESYNLRDATISLSGTSFNYTGNEIKPSVTVKMSYGTRSYKPVYSRNVYYYDYGCDWGWDYCGDWDIYTADRHGCSWSYPIDYYPQYCYEYDIVYNYSDRTLVQDRDYYVVYSNNIEPGTATVSVYGKGSFAGYKETTFTINGNGGTVTTSGPSKHVTLAGANRYDTMSAIVDKAFTSTKNTAVVASGTNFPDALSASALAGSKKAPVILTDGKALSYQAKEELERLKVKEVFLLGGEAAVSADVQKAITDMGIKVTRIAGDSRIATSINVFNSTVQAKPKTDTVIIATGYKHADSLSIGPWAYSSCTPVILTQKDGTLSDAAVSAIKGQSSIKNVLIVGGASAVSDTVQSQLGTGYSYQRLSGANRYETSRAIAGFEAGNGFSWKTPVVATGVSFADALAGTSLAGSKKSPLLLVSSSGDTTISAMGQHKADITSFYVLGGEAAMSSSLVQSIEDAIR